MALFAMVFTLIAMQAPGARAQDAAKQQVLLAFGDSLTQGYGLPQGTGLVPQLSDWLTAQGRDVKVVNGGVSGDTTAGGLARIDWSLTPDVTAVMVILGGNDLLRGTDPSVTRANLDGILKAIAAKHLPILLVGLQATANYGSSYQQQFDAIYPALAQTYGAVFVPSFYDGIVPDAEASPQRLQAFLQADGIHPNPEGVKREVAALGPKVLEVLDRAGG